MDALATAGELDIHLQREVDPDRAELALQLASGAVRAYCGWNISQTVETLTATGDATIVLTLPTLQLNDVTEVRIGGVVQDITPLYATWTRRGQILRFAGWPQHSEVEVDCDHGYLVLPDVIKLLVLEQAARHMNNPTGLTSATVGRVTRTFATTSSSSGGSRLTELDQRLLDQFKI